jgi:hypothetical protein
MSERDGYPANVPCWIETSQPHPEAAVPPRIRLVQGTNGSRTTDFCPSTNRRGLRFLDRSHPLHEEECLHELRSWTGELLWRMPDVHDVYDKAPPNEDRRDGWVRGSDMEGIGVPLDQALPYFACSPKEQ